MIENIRKYTGLMIVVLVLLFVGLVFLGDGVGNSLGSKPVMKVAGLGISQKDFDRHRAAFDLPQQIPNTHFLPRETRLLASHYLGDTVIDYPQLLPGSIIAQMSQYLQANPQAPGKFITNRLNIQKAGIEYGVTPSPEEVESFVENVLFADPEGNYDQETYSDFIKNRVSAIGGTKGFNEYIRDLLTAQNLSKLLGGGIAPEMETVRAIYDTRKQIISAQQISLESATYEGKISPTEEQLKEYYEENQGDYNSDELRSISYVLIEPDWKAALDQSLADKKEADKLAEEARKKQEEIKKAAEEEAKKANEINKPAEAPKTEEAPKIEEAPKTEEAPKPADAGAQGDPGEPGDPAPAPEKPAGEITQPAPADKPIVVPPTVAPPVKTTPGKPNAVETTPAPPMTPKEQLTPDEKKKAVETLIPDINKFFQDLADNKGEEFEKFAAEYGYKVIKTDLFSQSDPPKELSSFIRNGKVFLLPATGDPDEKLSNPYQTDDGWFIGRLDEVVQSVPLGYEEAKVQVSIDLKKKLAREQMIEDANALHEKLTAAVKAGKTFEEAAKEVEQTTTKLEKLTEGQSFQFGQGQSQKMPDPPAFEAARFTNPGEIAPIKFTPSEDEAGRALIVYVEKREVIKDDEYLTGLDNNSKGLAAVTRLIAFENWLNDRYTESDVEAPKMAEQQP
jgi:hypothetical protein